jgi:micrococcal nuclease
VPVARRPDARGRLAAALAAATSLLLALTGCGGNGPAPPRAGAATGTLPAGIDFTVDRVVDGDTIVVSRGGTVRLIGVDTPETKDPRRPVGCFGKEASRFTASLLPRGTRVRLVGDVEQRDRYDRTLAYVYRVSDGLFVNAELLRRGYGQVLTIPPNVAHAEEFVALAGQARAAGVGLWQACRHP